MALKEFEFGFGKTTQKVSLPEEHILDVLEGAPTPACDVKAATLECMRHPIGSKPLTEIVSKGDKVCIVCADVTRIWNHSDQYVIHIVNELNRGGIPDDDICILFAQGTHREQTPEEDIAVVGEELTHRVKLYQHRCKQMDELVHVGDTKRGTPVWLNKHAVEADKIIVVDGITPHLFAGYGGGRKLILPGVAGDETIQINHCHALGEKFGSGINPKTRSTLLDDNPVSDDMQEASDIYEPAAYLDSFKYETEADMEKALREHFTIPFFVAFNLFCMTHQYTIILVTKPENFEAIRKTNQIPVATVEEAWEIAKKKMEDEGKKDYTITVMAHCASIVPYKD